MRFGVGGFGELGGLDACGAVHAQPLRRAEIDEQHSDGPSRGDVAHGQIHAVAVVAREHERRRVQHAHESGIAAFVRAARLAAAIHRREEKQIEPLDEGAIVVREPRRNNRSSMRSASRCVSNSSCSLRWLSS
jgi:hypothetical protein